LASLQIDIPHWWVNASPQNGMSHPCRTKTQGGNVFEEAVHFWHWSLADLGPCPNFTCAKLGWSENFQQDLFIPSKVIQLSLNDKTLKTDKCTPSHPYMNGQIFSMTFWSLSPHYVCLAHSIYKGLVIEAILILFINNNKKYFCKKMSIKQTCTSKNV